jgi:1,4-dihydroxy-6-naphthoate synthase
MRQHIELYVNPFSLGLGEAGRRAVETLLAVYRRVNPDAPIPPVDLFS